MMTWRFVLLLVLFVTPVWAGPLSVEERAAEREALFSELRVAKTEPLGRAAEDRVWRFWMEGPSEKATALVTKAMERRRWYDFAGALKILNEVVKIAPNWAEGWNQRAFIHFLRESYDKSLEDLERAIELEPKHFAALSGKARILMRQGRIKLGQEVLREAVKLHPWLKERDMLLLQPGEEL